MKRIIYFIFLLLPSTNVAQSISTKITEVMEKHHVVGATISVVKKGKIAYSQSFGLKDIDSNTPLGFYDQFRIASISKSFTATAFMQLVDQGKASLQDDISDYLGFTVRNPKYPNKKITIEMILSHTSSINDKNGYFTLDIIQPAIENNTWEKSFNNDEPGTSYQYCNLNYNIAGAILEQITKQNFHDYIVQNIFKPLEIKGGYNVKKLDKKLFTTIYNFEDNKFVAQPNAYTSRATELKHYKLGFSTPILSPTGGVKISGHDLTKYMMMHMNYGKYKNTQILSEQASKNMQTSRLTESKYGLGLHQTSSIIAGRTLIGHTGSAYGLHSCMFFDPAEKFGFVIITNGCIAQYDKGDLTFSKDMIKILYENFIL